MLLPDLCIGARDEVVSVVLVSREPPALLDGATVYVSDESASGRNLLRVILERRYGVQPAIRRRSRSARARAPRRAGAADRRRARSTRSNDFRPTQRLRSREAVARMDRSADGLRRVGGAPRRLRARSRRDVRDCMHALTDAYTWSRAHSLTVVEPRSASSRGPRVLRDDITAN